MPAKDELGLAVDLANLDLAVDFVVDLDTALDAGFLFVIFAGAQGAA